MKSPASISMLVCILFLSAASSLCAAQSSYTITDLGALSSKGYSVARAVNATGEATGASGNDNSNVSDVMLYSDGAMTSLGTRGGTSGFGNGINASGQVAGYPTNSTGTYRAFLTNGSVLTDIGDLGGGSAVAYALNDRGVVVGSAVTANGENHPFAYYKGRMLELGTLGSGNNELVEQRAGHQQLQRRDWNLLRCAREFLRLRLEERKDDEGGNLGRPLEPGVRHQQQGPDHRRGLHEEWLGARVRHELLNLRDD